VIVRTITLSLDDAEADLTRRALTRAWADAPAGSLNEAAYDALLVRLGAAQDAADNAAAEATRLFGPDGEE